MASLATAHGPRSNPLDILEELVSANDWPFERSSDSELMVNVSGRWCDYHLCFMWEDSVRAVFFSCHLDQKIPPAKRRQVQELMATFNESLWLGHVDMTARTGALMFRHTMPLRGAPVASVEQLEDVMDTAVDACEQLYPALQLVLWGGHSVEDALKTALMETVGEA